MVLVFTSSVCRGFAEGASPGVNVDLTIQLKHPAFQVQAGQE